MHDKSTNESVRDYKIRLCQNKDSFGLTWKNIADLVSIHSDVKLSEDSVRKFWRYYSEGYEDGISSVLDKDSDDIFEEIQNKTDALKRERIKLQDQNREVNARLRNEARFEVVKEEILRAISEVAHQKPLVFNKPKQNNSGVEGALLLSDWHVGLFANNYWNHFDNDEFVRRVVKLVEKSVEYNRLHNVQTLHIFNMGDFVNGLIHVTSRILSTMNVVSQTQYVSEILAEVISELANVVPNIKLYFVRGNHDRVSPNKSDENAKESFADFIPWWLKERLSEFTNIEFMNNKYDDEIASADICGYLCYSTHGHRDNINNVAQNLSLMTKQVPDYIFLGHYHHAEENEIQGVEVIINSSLSGVDSYAKEIRKISKPAQRLLLFNKEEGRFATYNIKLGGI